MKQRLFQNAEKISVVVPALREEEEEATEGATRLAGKEPEDDLQLQGEPKKNCRVSKGASQNDYGSRKLDTLDGACFITSLLRALSLRQALPTTQQGHIHGVICSSSMLDVLLQFWTLCFYRGDCYFHEHVT